MSRLYSCNQYDDGYSPTNLRNWEVPKFYCHVPQTREGSTQFIANERGYIIPGYPRAQSRGPMVFCAWDFPKKITRKVANEINGLAYIKDRKKRCLIRKRSFQHPPQPIGEEDEEVLGEEVQERAIKESKTKTKEEENLKDVCPMHKMLGDVQPTSPDEPKFLVCPIHNTIVRQREEKIVEKKIDDGPPKFCKCIS